MPRLSKSKSLRVGAIVVAVIVIYAVLGFVVAPRVIRSALLKDVPEMLGATPKVGEIHINPFLLKATIDDFSLTARNGEKLTGFKRLLIDFQLSSIWHRAYTFANIDVTSPYLSAVVGKDGRLNLLQLKPKNAPSPQTASSEAALPALRIGSFKVSQGTVVYEDQTHPDMFAARLEPLNFELRDFTTGVDGGKFTFTAGSKMGERIEWHGHLSVDPVESDGEFQINGLLAHTLWEYLQDQVNFDVDSGRIDLAATYRYSLKDPATTNLTIDLSKASLTDLKVGPKRQVSQSAGEPWITVPSLSVTAGTVDLGTRRAHVDRVSLTGLKLLTWMESDKSLNLMKLAGAPDGSTAPAATASAASAAAPVNVPWAFDVRQFELRDASVATEDRGVQPVVKVLLAPLSLTVDGASQDMTKAVKIAGDTRINEGGTLSFTGTATPQPAVANLDLKLNGIEMATLQPYIAQQTAMTLLAGTLGASGKFHYGSGTQPAIQFAGDVNVEKLHTIDNTLHDDFINWDRLDVLGLNFTQAPDRLEIEKIIARKLYARVIIETDSSINVKRVLKIPAVAVERVGARAAALTNAAPHAAAVAASPSMPMSIKKIVVEESQANFSDFSVKPNFATGIQQLKGTVIGLSTKPGSRATVDLKGGIDAFSPVSISGEVNVLGPLYTDLTMSFRNISLPVFDPYSGKFAGYNIAKGKLDTELHYKIDGRKLDAQHHIVVKQLEFGEATASKEAVSLPIKLAVSLLKDRNGVIDLNIPVTGSLDDPEFRLAPVVWKVFVNILEKAISEPFTLLASLFGSGPDLQFIDFKPGRATLDATALDKAQTIAKALIERPQLKIDVPIAVVPEIDGPALMETAFQSRLQAMRTTRDSPKKSAAPVAGSAAAPAAFDQLDPATQLDVLTRLYAQEAGAAPKYSDEVNGLADKSEKMVAKITFLNKELRARLAVGDAELQALGQQRAAALQQALLADSHVEAERVFLVANDRAIAKDGVVRLELSLK